jgi:hypothetical protein
MSRSAVEPGHSDSLRDSIDRGGAIGLALIKKQLCMKAE